MEEVKPKTCAKCVHLKGRRDHPWDAKEWQCFKGEWLWDLVTGNKIYKTCYDLRLGSVIGDKHYCGLNGDWYEEYVPPVRTENLSGPTIGGQSATELTTEIVFDPEQLRKNREAAAAAIAAKKAAKGLL